jgi:hypothetical protein
MKYPKTMQEATQAAHEERSKAFFEMLNWGSTPLHILISLIRANRKGHEAQPSPSHKGTCTP